MNFIRNCISYLPLKTLRLSQFWNKVILELNIIKWSPEGRLHNNFNVSQDFTNALDAYVAELADTTYSYSVLEQPQITFRDLTGTAVGETTGEGADATSP